MTAPFAAPLSEPLESLLAAQPENDPVSAQAVAFRAGDVDFGSFVARPSDDSATAELRPAVLIISDWSGLNDHARARAVMLARLGYIAMAGDVYGGGVQLPPNEAGPAAGKFYGDPELFRARMLANLEQVRSLPGVDPDRIAVMGYCFGGSGSLELVRTGVELAGVVSFHGRLQSGIRAGLGDVRTPILLLTGANDPVVPDDSVIDFENEMREAEAPDWQVVSYSGAMHAFTMPEANAPDHGATFNARANERSWQAMRAFFDEIFA
ncbi:dienelactone hydrolase family protein [Subtercola endophyticus]|uniref:dienelactone hydrolase family protein n=1 Tax=Subtercola endophyticus TaxID=2895559 RepID=UPI001E2E346B|nr:dienelactone hydrolase family protein [Subtercola endophyticus]UFS58701.1 dienelactone hydrolase family protein [Subtercola endophyticus]